MRVLVIGPPDGRGALAAVRALGMAGWQVGYGCPSKDNLVSRSRWLNRWHPVPWPQHGVETFHRALVDALFHGRYEVIFAGGDDWLMGLDAVRERLDTSVPYPPSLSLRRSMDKLELARLAQEVGLRAPRTVLATDESIAGWTGSAVLKAREHWLPGPVDPPVHLTTQIAHDRSFAARRAAEIRSAGAEPLLQEYLSGPLIAVTTLTDQDARPVARLQQAVLRTWPAPAGISTRARTVPVSPELAAGLDALLARLNWFGLAQAQFLVTERGPALVDLNPRFYGSLALAMEAGLNLPVLWARMATGRPVPERSDARVGARYSWLEGDIRRACLERRAGLLRDVGSSVAWSLGAMHSITDVHDPWPAMRFGAALLNRAAGAMARRSS